MTLKKQISFQEFIKDFIIGGISGSISGSIHTITYGTIVRCSDILTEARKDDNLFRNPYRAMFIRHFTFSYCSYQIYQQEGLRGLFQGNYTYILRHIPKYALNFSLKDAFQRILNKKREKDGQAIWFASNIASGALAGFVSQPLVYSLSNASKILQKDNQNHKKNGKKLYNGLIDVYRKTLQTDGFGSLYKGFVISWVGAVVYRSIYFGFYDTIKPLLPQSTQNYFIVNYILGYIVTAFATVIYYPFQTIKLHMMSTRRTYYGYVDCARQFYQLYGIKSLFQGSTARIFYRPGAAAISTYDYIKRLIDQPNSE